MFYPLVVFTVNLLSGRINILILFLKREKVSPFPDVKYVGWLNLILTHLKQRIMIKLKTKLFNWLFKDQLQKLEAQQKQVLLKVTSLKDMEDRVKYIFNLLDVSIDVHTYSSSWAVLSLQGKKTNYIKFIELGDSDLKEISQFMRRYSRHNVKVDANPSISGLLKLESLDYDG